MKVKLSRLIDAIDFHIDGVNFYLDKDTGEVHDVSDDDWARYDDGEEGDPDFEGLADWEKEHMEEIWPVLEGLGSDRYVELPGQFDFDGYRVMENFIDELPEGRMKDDLWRAIEGRGAFRRFKDEVHRHGVHEKWYAFRDAAPREFMIEWCKDENIDVIDDIVSGHPEELPPE